MAYTIGFDGQILPQPAAPPTVTVPPTGATADAADVEAGLVQLVAAACYPNPQNIPVKVFRGWPVPAQLDADLAAGVVTVSVYASDVEGKVTRHLPRWVDLPAAAPTLVLTAINNTVTASGTPDRSNACVVTNGKAYVYPASSADTLQTVAQGLAALIPGATSSGATVAVPGAAVAARVGGFGTAVRELKRQKKGYQITVWAGTPALRDAVAPLADAALAATDYLPLPDGFGARLLYERSRQTDRAERDGLYRRDLFYSAEFATTQSQTAARVTSEAQTITPL